MHNMNRRSFLRTVTMASAVVATAGATGVGSAFARAPAEFTLKLSNNLPEAHPMIVRLKEMAAKIDAESKGRINLQIYPNSQLGSDTDMLSQTRAGAVDFLLLSPLILGTLISPVQISNVGFAFSGYNQVWAAMDGDLGAHVRKQIASSSSLFAFEKIFDTSRSATYFRASSNRYR